MNSRYAAMAHHLLGVAVLVVVVAMTTTPGGVQAQNMELEYTLAEERPAMTSIGNVLYDSNLLDLVPAEDVADLRYSFLTEGNPDSAMLWVNSTSGELRTYTKIDRETLCPRLSECELNVQTVIQAQLTAFFMIIRVKVTITDINDHTPTFQPSTLTVYVPEDETPGATTRLPTALDPDTGVGNSVIDYSQTGDLSDSPFTLVVSGQPGSFGLTLRLKSALDRETRASYRVLVSAADGGNPTLTGSLTVSVEVVDVNDNPPVFETRQYFANISEATTVDEVVTTVKATDLDSESNGQVSYVMPPVQEDQVLFSMFAVNNVSGEVRALIPLDSYAGRTYRLVVVARDAGVSPMTATAEVVISVLDTHNSDPEILLNVFGQYGMAQVSERAELGRAVAHVAVTDPDSNLSPNGQVSCSVDSEEFQLQAMDVNQYKVILTKRLDREDQAFHSVTVTCEDSGVPARNATSTFLVEVTDENDSPPVFDSLYYTADVTEGNSDRSVLVTLRASDQDTGVNAQVSYRLQDGADTDFTVYNDGSFVLSNPDGADREDPEKGSVREVQVLAVDGGTPALTATATVVVNIRDINDNPPQFSQPVYSFVVPERSPLGTPVNNLSATDADLEVNAIFYYKMDPVDEDRVPFELGLGGAIRVTDSLDRETTPSYEFHAIAYDLGEPVPLSSTVLVHVKISDVNDNSPEFLFPNDDNNTLHVPHTLGVNTAFGNILAEDMDEGNNGKLVYARDSGNGSKFFDIDSDSGQIILVQPLSLQELGLHILAVVAHDRGVDTQMATQSLLHIIVYEGNATLARQEDGIGFRNTVVVVVLVVVTLVLALAILLTILLIRRVDKQRRLYNTKAEEAKVDSNMRHLHLGSGIDVEASTSLSDITGDTKEGGKKKKEVSFSLDEDNNINQHPAMTTFTQGLPDKYDPVSDNDGGKIKNDMLMTSNHYQPERHLKSSSLKKDVNSFTFHQVHPTSGACRQMAETIRQHDDNLSDVSADVSTSDSGRGGSDVELQSHGGASRESGDTSFASQRGLGVHNNLSLTISNPGASNYPLHSTSKGSISSSSSRNPNSKAVHFQNIRPDASYPHAPLSTRPPRGPINSSSKNTPNTPRLSSNPFSDDDGSYVKLANRNGGSGRRSNPSNQELETHRNKMLNDNFSSNPGNRHLSSANQDGEYMDMHGVRSLISMRSNSNSCIDGSGWDGDTTTSGSYTVDPQELCEEIDKLFFDEFQDVVV